MPNQYTKSPPLARTERFWTLVNKTEDCWMWMGARSNTGYGTFWDGQRNVYAHRFAYGDVPNGLQIDHLCRVRLCVNPAHLEAVTSRENTLRGVSPPSINILKTVCLRGHALSGDNLIVYWKGRKCRECQRWWNLKWAAKRTRLRTALRTPTTTPDSATQ